MGGISSSTGLISGFDIAGLVKQLMEIESRPLLQLQTRVESVNAQKLAYQTINAQLMGALSAISRLAESRTFTARTATSSQPEALTVTAEPTASVGSYSFLVRSIVSTHQVASLGFADRNVTPVGAGTLTFETAQARVDPDTELSVLNGGAGVRRGQIRITDRANASATIDLRSAYTVRDVLEAINSQSQVAVRAYIQGDRIVLEDVTGLPAGTGQLTVTNVGTGLTATDLGILGSEDGSGRIASSVDLVRLTGATTLASLNDGLGVRFNTTQSDFRITLANGRSFEIDLSNAFSFNTSLAELNGGQGVGPGTIRITNKAGVTKELHLTGTESLNDVKALLASDEYKDLNVTFTSASSSGTIILSDNSEGTGMLEIEDVTGSIAAQLKIAGKTSDSAVTGKANYQFTTINSLIRRIQYARDADGNLNDGAFEIAVSADGKGLTLIDHTTGGTATIEALNGSMALQDLGLTGTFQNGTLTGGRLASGLNTVLLRNLNGGAGVRLGVVQFQLRDGTTQTVDLSNAQTLQDIINLINQQGSLRAEVSAGGTGLTIQDLTEGTALFTASGETLEDLHVAGSSATGRLVGGDLNRKYISETTLLSSLNGGKGIGLTAGQGNSTVKFQITNTAGQSVTITLSGSLHQTIGDVINTINQAAADIGVTAQVNANGDGIMLVDQTEGGTGRLTVSELSGGSAAAALGIKGQASAANPGVLTGSLAGIIEIGPADTLDDVVNKINSAGLNVRASILNDGSGSRPYRLVVTSTASGTAGQIAFNTGTSGLAFETLTEATDARVVVGNIDSPNSIVVSSSTNKITGVVQGLTLDLLASTATAVQVNVATNTDSTVNDLKSFVTAYNAVLDRLGELTKFDPKTNERGVLLGDHTVRQIQDRLYRQLSRSLSAEYSLRRLSSVGLKFGSGGRLELDEQAFRDALEKDPQAVQNLFTKTSSTTDADGKEKVQYIGIAAALKEELRLLTSSAGGLISSQTDRLDDKIELYNRRIEDLKILLNNKEERYYKQFQAMEKALSDLQAQQSSLSALSSLASSFGSTSRAGL
ncbi:MAG TPA: flagellar filament capping protein FliD [Phycisphaerae bacterium]|nr:flagellar filament capping protein FliD [Phycisphaerae bacterium]HPP26854.1 flagellar filament capping protein FliD [Phycisphaerae bacterium]